MIIDPDGLANGRRIRRLSNDARLHFVLFLVYANGFGRIELDYFRIVAAIYGAFEPKPTEDQINAWIQEWREAYLLFVYQYEGTVWGQFDVKPSFLPRYKTAADKNSPFPPETAFSEWKSAYRAGNKGFTKSFENASETLPETLQNIPHERGGEVLCREAFFENSQNGGSRSRQTETPLWRPEDHL